MMFHKLRTFHKVIIASILLLLLPVYVEAFWHGLSIAQGTLTKLQVIGGPSGYGASSYQTVGDFECNMDNSVLDPVFSNAFCINAGLVSGQADYTGLNGIAKTTFSPIVANLVAHGSGQRTAFQSASTCEGMGDCWAGVWHTTYAGADSSQGDEGQGFFSVSTLAQQNFSDSATITSVARTTCNTTTTQAITGSQTAQAVTVSSTTGCNVNDWLVVAQQMPNGNEPMEAVKITAVGGGTITAIYRFNRSSGVTLTPATVLGLNLTAGFPGQQRIMVNMTATPVIAGTVSSISGGSFTGSGTSWSAGMVGGTSTNIGCIELTADRYADGGNHFKSNAIDATFRAWYQIVSVGSGTSLGIFSESVAGDQAYHGQGPVTPPPNGSIQNPASAYSIRPCVEILNPGSNGSTVIAETTSTTWNVGDTVEIALSPYPDVEPMTFSAYKFGTGGQNGNFIILRNSGAASHAGGISLTGDQMVFNSNATGLVDWHSFIPFVTGFSCGQCAIGADFSTSVDEALRLGANGVTGGASFIGVISGNTLTVSSVTGTVGAGQPISGAGVNPRTFIRSGSGTTWTISGPPQSVGSEPMQSGVTDNAGKIFWGGAYIMPNSANLGMDFYGVSTGNGGKLQIISNNASAIGGGNLSGMTFAGMFGTAKTTMANTPTCTSALEGYQVAVTDAAGTLGYGNTITGGSGANHVLAYCNGTNWTFH